MKVSISDIEAKYPTSLKAPDLNLDRFTDMRLLHVKMTFRNVNVHEDIKVSLPSYDKYIAKYITTIRNLAKHGVKVIIYNFVIPVC